MRQAEAEFLVLHEWENWWANHPKHSERASGTDALEFFAYLVSKKRLLLDFRCEGSQWQIVRAWLLRKGLIND